MKEVAIIIGPDARDDGLLELGAVYEDGDVTIVHAMKARPVWRNASTSRKPMPLYLLGADSWALAEWFESDAAIGYLMDPAR